MSQYVAYVSSYTHGNEFGISIFDVDLKKGRFKEKGNVKITNSSYLTISHNRQFLYSITDMGVEAYKVKEDGLLEYINSQSINGMRGCYLSTSYNDKFLFVAGYHDGKITALKLKEDGSIGDITDEIYLKGMGSLAERNFRPHVGCVKMTRDDKFLLAADMGMDHVNVYSLDPMLGRLKLVDIIRSEQESAPKHIKISKDGKYIYIVHEIKCIIDVYSYNVNENNVPEFTKIQTVPTTNTYHTSSSAACNLNLSDDSKFVVTSNAGDNTAAVFKILQDGTLDKILCLPVSGEYPKDVALIPGNKFLVSANHESDTLTFFSINMENGTLIMNGPEMKVIKPNCIIFHKLQ